MTAKTQPMTAGPEAGPGKGRSKVHAAGAADAIGRVHAPAGPDARIVSLVPSITELLFELGAGDRLVGRTGFCVHPRERIRTVPKVGGTKSVDVERIRALAPTHLIVNIDENEKPTVDRLADFVPNVIVTHPLAPLDNLELYRMLGGIFGREARAAELCAAFSQAYDAACDACASLPRERVLYLIWRAPWMTVSRNTYVSRTLAAVGWDTLATPGPQRYPEIVLTPELLASVDRILLSSEPYAFRERHLDEIRRIGALGGNLFIPTAIEEPQAQLNVALIDGEMTSWYGSRAIAGMRYLARLRIAS